jgi:hypothetical protein
MSRVSAAESSPNNVLNFRAVGKDASGNSINVTSAGGDLIYHGKTVHLVPWNSRQSEVHGRWVFFLANVTGTDFYIAYLHLDNVTSDTFGIYLFHYEDGEYAWHGGFSGQQSVGPNTVLTPKMSIPPLSIQASAKFPNRLFISGASLEITGNEGRFDNKRIYSLLNIYNVTGSAEGYNALWLLATDGSYYYYGILYLPNNDHSSVLYGNELRLNDLATQYTEGTLTVPATWYLETTASTLSISSTGSQTDTTTNTTTQPATATEAETANTQSPTITTTQLIAETENVGLMASTEQLFAGLALAFAATIGIWLAMLVRNKSKKRSRRRTKGRRHKND